MPSEYIVLPQANQAIMMTAMTSLLNHWHVCSLYILIKAPRGVLTAQGKLVVWFRKSLHG